MTYTPPTPEAHMRTHIARLSLLATIALPALAQEKPADLSTVFFFERASLADSFVDPRDAALLRAGPLWAPRVAELRGQLPMMFAMAPNALSVASTLIARPTQIAITYNPAAADSPTLGYGLIFSCVTESKQQAASIHSFLAPLAKNALHAEPCEKFQGMVEFDAGPIPAAFGPWQHGDQWRFDAIAGSIPDPAKPFAHLPEHLIKSDHMFLRGEFTPAALEPLLTTAEKSAKGEDAAMAANLHRRLTAAGLFGSASLHIRFEGAYSDTETLFTMRADGAAKTARSINFPVDNLDPADFKAIPADATHASLFRADLGPLKLAADELAVAQPDFAQALQTVLDRTGIDIRADLLATLGGSVGMYTSFSTGTGDFGSAVFFTTFKDRPRFVLAHQKLVNFLNGLSTLVPAVPGWIRIASWKDGDQQLYSLRCNGLPVPFEFTYALTDRYLVAALTPQAAIVACKQIAGKGDAGLLSSSLVDSAAKDRIAKGVASFAVSDSLRNAREGYTSLSMLGSAISNALRSPTDTTREPGMIVPLPAELLKGGRPSVSYSYWQGDDLISESRADRSMLYNMSASLGMLSGGSALYSAIGSGIQAANASRSMSLLSSPDVLPLFLEPWWTGATPTRIATLMRLSNRELNASLPASATP